MAVVICKGLVLYFVETNFISSGPPLIPRNIDLVGDLVAIEDVSARVRDQRSKQLEFLLIGEKCARRPDPIVSNAHREHAAIRPDVSAQPITKFVPSFTGFYHKPFRPRVQSARMSLSGSNLVIPEARQLFPVLADERTYTLAPLGKNSNAPPSDVPRAPPTELPHAASRSGRGHVDGLLEDFHGIAFANQQR